MQLSALVVQFDHTGKRATLEDILIMQGRRKKVIVPKGFQTDFASIPQIIRSLIPQLGKYTAPAVVHDYLYWCGPSMCFTKKMADDLFLDLMKDAGVRFTRRWTIYMGLRIGGFVAWNGHRKAGHTCKNAIEE